MSLALTRVSEAAYSLRARATRPASARRDYGELASKVFILTLFSAMATSIAQDFVQTGHVTGLLLLVSEALVVALTLVRRTAAIVDRSWKARILTMFATFGPPLVRPAGVAVAPEVLTIIISAIGLMIVVLGKLSLGRSFGLTPANRGVVSSGLYRMVRHPIYLGYLITHVGFVIANPADWNLAVLLAADVALLLRAICEERTLALDDEYRAYMGRVRWRIIPGVF
jgi:protein-S-isoprenylcysteine O-methyltransferase Ste14